MPRAQTRLAIAIGCALGLQASTTWAAEWETSAGVAPRIVATDNVCLTNDDEESDVYAVVRPSASVKGTGRRANVSLTASVDLNTLSDGDLRDNGCSAEVLDRDEYLPQMRASADAVLIDQWFFIDANASSSQNEVSPFLSGGGDAADRRGNVNTTYRYAVSPYLKRRFKDVGELLVRYTWDDQYNTKDIVGESTEQRAVANFSSGSTFYPFTWGLQGYYSDIEYEDTPGRSTADSSELKSAQFNLAYQLNRSWAVNGYYGDEWNDFVSSRDDIDGDYWGAGLIWTPNSRTRVEAGTGDRFFGTTPWLRVKHRYRRSQLSLNYEQTLTYNRNIRTLGIEDDFFGQPTTLTNSPILDERVSLNYAYNGRRFDLGVVGSFSDQTREGGGDFTTDPAVIVDESRFKSAIVSLSRPVTRNFNVRTRVGWREQEPKNNELSNRISSETWSFSLGASRKFGDNLSASLDYLYTDRSSDLSIDEYQENRITLTVRATFL